MMANRAVVCLLCVCVMQAVTGHEAPVGSLCRPNERLLSCGGCQKTCRDPNPPCAAVCKTGCYCNEGEVRDDNYHCVKLADCPPVAAELVSAIDTSEPRPEVPCPENEEYRFCEPCGQRTCENPNPMCPAQCARGCFCKGHLLRNKEGQCVDFKSCGRHYQALYDPYYEPHKPVPCGLNEVYKECTYCENTCTNPRPECPARCLTGCFCDDGFYRNSSGVCVKLEDCPKTGKPYY